MGIPDCADNRRSLQLTSAQAFLHVLRSVLGTHNVARLLLFLHGLFLTCLLTGRRVISLLHDHALTAGQAVFERLQVMLSQVISDGHVMRTYAAHATAQGAGTGGAWQNACRSICSRTHADE